MLILTRRVGERLIIGDEVVINVLGVNGNQIRLGVDAPKNVTVHREEIYDRIQAEKDHDPEERERFENPNKRKDEPNGNVK